MMINLTQLKDADLTDYLRNLLLRGWVWLILPECDPLVVKLRKRESA